MQTSVWFNGIRIDVDNVAGADTPEAGFPGGRHGSGLLASSEGFDRGMAFGDGVFETMLLRIGHADDAAQLRTLESAIHLFPRHLQRLSRGLQVLGIDCPEQRIRTDLQLVIDMLADEAGGENQCARYFAVKLLVTRGYSGLGYRAGNTAANQAVLLIPLPIYTLLEPAEVGICELRLAAQPQLAGVKHCNRLEQVMARREVVARGLDEGLVLDYSGQVIEATSANLFLLKNRRLITPPLQECGVKGVMRDFIFSVVGPELGLEVAEQAIDLEALYEAEAIILTNSLIGARQVSRCETVVWNHSRLLQRIQERIMQSITGAGVS